MKPEQAIPETFDKLAAWNRSAVLREVYRGFHRMIAAQLPVTVPGPVVELGSGFGSIKEVIPQCVCTDVSPGVGIDRVENAYRLNFADETVACLILFDVFHHLRHPGTALAEFRRVLRPGGRVVVFDPCVSLLGLLVYGLLHKEPVALGKAIGWLAPPGWSSEQDPYYSAQGNAYRVFGRREQGCDLSGWHLLKVTRLSALSYVLSGGYSHPPCYPFGALPLLRWLDRVCDLFPAWFATRMLAVLEKPDGTCG